VRVSSNLTVGQETVYFKPTVQQPRIARLSSIWFMDVDPGQKFNHSTDTNQFQGFQVSFLPLLLSLPPLLSLPSFRPRTATVRWRVLRTEFIFLSQSWSHANLHSSLPELPIPIHFRTSRTHNAQRHVHIQNSDDPRKSTTTSLSLVFRASLPRGVLSSVFSRDTS
jgi:hypothetical protein